MDHLNFAHSCFYSCWEFRYSATQSSDSCSSKQQIGPSSWSKTLTAPSISLVSGHQNQAQKEEKIAATKMHSLQRSWIWSKRMKPIALHSLGCWISLMGYGPVVVMSASWFSPPTTLRNLTMHCCGQAEWICTSRCLTALFQLSRSLFATTWWLKPIHYFLLWRVC